MQDTTLTDYQLATLAYCLDRLVEWGEPLTPDIQRRLEMLVSRKGVPRLFQLHRRLQKMSTQRQE